MPLKAEIKNYGSWKSPVSGDLLAEGTSYFCKLLVDRDDLYWIEIRPKEGGRAALISKEGFSDILGPNYNARSSVHEYGGGAALIADQVTYFTNYKDQQIYKVEGKNAPQKITNAPLLRFADYVLHPNGLWLYAVVEDHSKPDSVQNTIARIDIDTGHIQTIVEGHDFFISPRLNKEGSKLAYVFWDFPNMPWNGTELWVADLNQSGLVETQKKVAGGLKESVIEPSWSPFNNKLYYVSDKTGFWNLYEQQNGILLQMNAEFAAPPWILGNHSYTFVEIDGRPFIASLCTEQAIDSLILINLKTKEAEKVDLPHKMISEIYTKGQNIVFLGASATESGQVIEYDTQTKTYKMIARSGQEGFSKDYISIPDAIEFPTEGGLNAYAFFYPPHNPDYQAPKGEKPPLIVIPHGGPTTHATMSKNLKVQYWTTRGFAVAQVNYGGSTGYGKHYQERLLSNWGKVDVDDCCNVAKYLSEKGLVDSKRMAIMGSSAGGYTVSAALTFRDTFQAGACYYGVSNLELLAKDTHKFEAKYLDLLVGRYPEEKEKYKRLSPIHHTKDLSSPIIFLQGEQDKIVPKEQSESMYQALLAKKIPTAYLLFEGEQHGFRKAETIKKAIDAVYYFYAKVFNFSPTEDVPAVTIENLQKPEETTR